MEKKIGQPVLSAVAEYMLEENVQVLKKCEPFLRYFSLWVWRAYFGASVQKTYQYNHVGDLVSLISSNIKYNHSIAKMNSIVERILYDMEVCNQGLLTLSDLAHIKSDKIALFTLSFVANCVYGNPSSLMQHHDPKVLLAILNEAIIRKNYEFELDDCLFVKDYEIKNNLLCDKHNEPFHFPIPHEFTRFTRIWLGKLYLWLQNQHIREFNWLPLERNDPDAARHIWEVLREVHFSHSPDLFVSLPLGSGVDSNTQQRDPLIEALTIACGDRYEFAVYTYLALIRNKLERKAVIGILSKTSANRKNKLKKRAGRD